MIFGIGNDILENKRIEKILNSKIRDRFLQKIFNDSEINYFKKKNFSYETITSYFCMKESILKAMGVGLKFDLKNLEILKDEFNKPFLKKNHKIDEFFKTKGIKNYSIYLSCSHIEEYSNAICVIEF